LTSSFETRYFYVERSFLDATLVRPPLRAVSNVSRPFSFRRLFRPPFFLQPRDFRRAAT
jgi:hypothetical protein